MTLIPAADRALARRLEACTVARLSSYVQAAIALHPAGASQPPVLLRLGESACGWLAPASPVNSCRGLGMQWPVTEAELDEVEEFFITRAGPVRLLVCPLAYPSLHALVRRRGYRLDGFQQQFAMPLAADFSPRLPPGIEVELLDPDRLEEWVRATGDDDSGGEPSPETRAILRPNGAGGLMFLARVEGQVAGGGALYPYLDGASAELGGSSVLPGFRRRGVHGALIQARAAAAARMGCDLLSFGCEPGADSARNAARAGFWLAYTNVWLALDQSLTEI